MGRGIDVQGATCNHYALPLYAHAVSTRPARPAIGVVVVIVVEIVVIVDMRTGLSSGAAKEAMKFAPTI